MLNLILLQIDSNSTSTHLTSSFFKDYAEYIVGVPVFILSTWLSIWIYKKQLNKKELTCISKEPINIVDINSAFKNRLEIRVDNKKVNDLSLLILEIKNTGNQPIKKDDFESGIVINLIQSINKNIDVLSAEITNKKPVNLGVHLTGNNTTYNISPSLLNPKDSFTVQFLVDFEDTNDIILDVQTRIAGINLLKQIKENSSSKVGLREYLIKKGLLVPFTASILVAFFSGSKILEELIELIKKLFR